MILETDDTNSQFQVIKIKSHPDIEIKEIIIERSNPPKT